jgi:hypothetical protein
MDKEYLEQLRAQAAEVRADLAERQANDTVIGLGTIVPRPPSGIIHKTIADARVVAPPEFEHDVQTEFTDNQLEILAAAMAEINRDMMDDALAPLLERIATLEGQISVLMALLNPNSKTIEASEVVRKLHVR